LIHYNKGYQWYYNILSRRSQTLLTLVINRTELKMFISYTYRLHYLFSSVSDPKFSFSPIVIIIVTKVLGNLSNCIFVYLIFIKFLYSLNFLFFWLFLKMFLIIKFVIFLCGLITLLYNWKLTFNIHSILINI